MTSVPEIARRLINGVWQTGVAEDSTGGGLPSGGTTGEVLTKESNADGDVGWEPGGGSQPITSPLDIDGCVLWLDASQLALADDAPVALWPDLSGNGYDAVQATADNQPVCKTNVQNGKRVVRFDATVTERKLILPTAGPILRNCPGMSVVYVCTNTISDWQAFFASINGDPTTARVKLSSEIFTVQPDDGGSSTEIGPNSAFDTTSGIGVYVGRADWSVVGDAGGLGNGELNGEANSLNLGSTHFTGVGLSSDTDSDLVQVGGEPFAENHVIDVAEVIVYNRVLTLAERDQLYAYVTDRWALPYVSFFVAL